MTRLALLALLLCACAPQDPADTLQPIYLGGGPRAYTEATPVMTLVGGDNPPFRLSGGNYAVSLKGPQDCVSRLTLRGPDRYEREIYQGEVLAVSLQLRDLKAGIYTPEWQPVPNTCEATLELLTQF